MVILASHPQELWEWEEGDLYVYKRMTGSSHQSHWSHCRDIYITFNISDGLLSSHTRTVITIFVIVFIARNYGRASKSIKSTYCSTTSPSPMPLKETYKMYICHLYCALRKRWLKISIYRKMFFYKVQSEYLLLFMIQIDFFSDRTPPPLRL